MIQSRPPTPVRNSKYLAIPPTPIPLRNIKMAPYCVELLEMMLEALFNDDKSAEILDRSPPG